MGKCKFKDFFLILKLKLCVCFFFYLLYEPKINWKKGSVSFYLRCQTAMFWQIKFILYIVLDLAFLNFVPYAKLFLFYICKFCKSLASFSLYYFMWIIILWKFFAGLLDEHSKSIGGGVFSVADIKSTGSYCKWIWLQRKSSVKIKLQDLGLNHSSKFY